MAFMLKSILADRVYAASLLRHIFVWYIRRTARGFAAAALSKGNRSFRLVLSEAIGAWRGPISLYRSWQQVRADTRNLHPDPLVPPVVTPTEPIHKP
jgi:hypothetical protein